MRAERFRDRMIKAADAFVSNLVESEQALDAAAERTREVQELSKPLNSGEQGAAAASQETPTQTFDPLTNAEELRTNLASADKLLKEMEGLLPRLFVVFRNQAVGNQATRLHRSMLRRLQSLREPSGRLVMDTHTGSWKSWEDRNREASELQNRAKQQLLTSFNSSIRKRRL
jgi:hypothetical protein